MVYNNATTTTASRWKEDDGSSKWTEVVSKKKQYHQQQQLQNAAADDPFAGMKSCVDYEQEIERLKQLVPKVPIMDSQHKKRFSFEKKFNTNNTPSNTTTTTTTTTSTATTTTISTTNNNTTHSHHNFLNNEFINTNNTTCITSPTTSTQPATLSISRSNSPDTTHSSDSDVSFILPEQIVTEQEKQRFLAFVRSWTGDCRRKGAMMDDLTSSSNSLWADQSPWSRRHNVQSQQYYSYQQPTTMLNKHGQQPIGMGRRNHHRTFGYAL